jgi:acyl-CoA synthetase (AMP-forming)/AMP-acid ligase II
MINQNAINEVTNMHWFEETLLNFPNREAMIHNSKITTRAEFYNLICFWKEQILREGIKPQERIAVEGDYSPNVCAVILALMFNKNIVIPITSSHESKRNEFLLTSYATRSIIFSSDGTWEIQNHDNPSNLEHILYLQLARADAPGLVLFSSGTTGKSKASVINVDKLLNKYRFIKNSKNDRGNRILTFLMLDHIGGINTLLYTLRTGGTIITIADREPKTILSAIEKFKVEVLPTTPTFLNLLLMSGLTENYNFSSLKLVTYGTEPMQSSVLKKLHEVFPVIKFKQTYGLSELGILPTKSKEDGSLWMKLGGEGFQYKIIDNILWIKSDYAMLGYLNADAPFDDEGYFNTQDMVETDGDYIKVLGRKSEIINVGGEKVYPQEVENIILQMKNVKNVLITGHPNPVVGNVVRAIVQLKTDEDSRLFRIRINNFCSSHLEPYKIPMIVDITKQNLHSERFKKIRNLQQINGY